MATTQALASEWYEGGTLHKATGRIWQQASEENQIATAADFAAIILKGQVNTMEQLKPSASQLANCITEATRGEGTNNMKVTEVAVACAAILKW